MNELMKAINAIHSNLVFLESSNYINKYDELRLTVKKLRVNLKILHTEITEDIKDGNKFDE